MNPFPFPVWSLNRRAWTRAAAVLLVVAATAGCGRTRNGPAESEDVELRLSRSRPEVPRDTGEKLSDERRNRQEDAEKSLEVYRIKQGDGLVMMIRTVTAEQMEVVVDENGEIRLPLLDPIRAVGLTVTELEQAIQKAYIQGKIYRNVTVHAYVPSRSYFLQGEIRAPGRYPLASGRITLLQAIAAAGGYSEFAAPNRVEIIRKGETIRVDAKEMERNPDKDMELESGDLIKVPRSRF
jgi:polysaccharide export outer membrane protein